MRNFLTICLCLIASLANAQVTPTSSINLSGTITTTNTFQTVQAKNNGRKGCSIQNPVTNTTNMFVYFDSTNSSSCSAATLGGSFTLTPGQPIYCDVNGEYNLSDQICITGTTAAPFTANFQ